MHQNHSTLSIFKINEAPSKTRYQGESLSSVLTARPSQTSSLVIPFDHKIYESSSSGQLVMRFHLQQTYFIEHIGHSGGTRFRFLCQWWCGKSYRNDTETYLSSLIFPFKFFISMHILIKSDEHTFVSSDSNHRTNSFVVTVTVSGRSAMGSRT